ncbi:uncharacterized protein STAUR_6092 [Stigmatella aurantiaca DW4/3-1]|uniref:Uncharacterized protein n=2 Tax=Stigmatella aurantiaca TaxID=41 RepID=Q08VQ1_STIAD|nr:uncharacterized protein STAUR_6092 [Stigmatella aurantiaca DW4/3-1]EAU64556.1 hypothetical protein STIAU_6288 [Stigmatella aurantiaca DW4/3-1]
MWRAASCHRRRPHRRGAAFTTHPRRNRTMHKAISLSAELAEIRNAVEGARFLADELATGGLEDRKRELQAPLTISAILVLVELRLHQVERVLRGEEDPLLLWAPQNDVSPIQAEDEEHDLVLRSWIEPGEDEEPSPRKKASKSPVQGTTRRTGPPPGASPDQPEEGGDQPTTTEPKS